MSGTIWGIRARAGHKMVAASSAMGIDASSQVAALSSGPFTGCSGADDDGVAESISGGQPELPVGSG